ncbi:MAG: 50S ribosomal protein L21 [Alphaproteobacteria bacterium MarineAlpha9_Bin2]|nr:MAG: 50S ribosomal protein L21 [Alphaproteobacteria bacterium MarineAlpha9_Bin2]
MNYAVIKSGGKQYKVISGDVILIEKNSAEKGSEIRFEDIIMLGEGANIKTKSSELASAAVIGEVIEQIKGPKITIFKKKRRQNYRRRKGHKQDLTVVRIKSIGVKTSTPKKTVNKKITSEKANTSKTKPSSTSKKVNIKSEKTSSKVDKEE